MHFTSSYVTETKMLSMLKFHPHGQYSVFKFFAIVALELTV